MRSILLGVAFLLGAPAAAQIGINTTSYHGYTYAQHEAQVGILSGQGFRPVSLTVSGGWSNARYAAVWVQQPGGPAWVTSSAMNGAQYLAARTTWTGLGYRPKLLSVSYGTGGSIYASVWVQDGVAAIDRTSIFDFTSLQNYATTARTNGRMMTQVSRYGGNYACVEEPNTDGVAWGLEQSANATEYQDDFLAHTEGGERPFTVSMSDNGSYLTVWRDDRIGDWTAMHDATSTALTTEKANQDAAGRFPLFIASSGSGSTLRHATIFGSRFTSLPRTLTKTGTSNIFFGGFDNWIETWMQQKGIRAASAAITRDGKLAYARGYTLAETGYPTTQPTTLFRIGSISKPVTVLLAHKLIEQGTGGLSATTPAMSFLGYTGTLANYDQIRTWHLCEHLSGMPGQGNGDPNEWSAATWLSPTNPFLPVAESTVVRYTADQIPLSTQPGLTWRYSNIGNTLLGRMIVHASGQSFFTCLQNELTTPLGITRFRRQSVRLVDHQADEARYHLSELALMPSTYYTDQRLLTRQYARRYWDSAGGMTTSAIDLARILAAGFHLGPDSPIVDTATQSTMQARQQRTTYTGGTSTITRGGWFWSQRPGGVYSHEHNGSTDGFYALALHRTDGIAVVILTNQAADFYGDDINPLVESVMVWPNTDQFPGYGLPSFPRRPQLTSVLPGRGSLPNVTDSSFAFRGARIGLTTSVKIGNFTLTAQNSNGSNWANGSFRIVADDELEVHPPQGLAPALYAVRAENAVGSSDAMVVSITLAPDHRLGATDLVTTGSAPLRVYATRGALDANSIAILGFSGSNAPSLVPGLVDLGIGNNLLELGIVGAAVFDGVTGTAFWDLPGIGPADPLYLQCAVLEPNVGFPLVSTNVEAVDRLF